MKLIYLSNVRMPTDWAHGIQIMKMCEAFARAGAKVELVVPRRFNKIKESPFAYYGVPPAFKITKLPCLDLMPLGTGKFIFLLQKFSFLSAAKIYLGFKKFDILYTREHLAGLFFKNAVLEIHTLPRKIKKINVKIWQAAKTLLVLTDFIKQKITAQGVAAEKISVSPDGVDLAEFDLPVSQAEARQEVNLPPDKKIIVYAGSFSLYDWKGTDVLLSAAKYLNGDELIVLVGGSESEIKDIKDKIKTTNVIFTGRKSHRLIPYYLKAADVLALPNKKGDIMSEQYTSPLKLFEYMAAGRPIVASDLPSIREILNGHNAVLVPPNNPEALAAAVRKILTDPKLGAGLAGQARQEAEKYTWDKRAAEILKKF